MKQFFEEIPKTPEHPLDILETLRLYRELYCAEDADNWQRTRAMGETLSQWLSENFSPFSGDLAVCSFLWSAHLESVRCGRKDSELAQKIRKSNELLGYYKDAMRSIYPAAVPAETERRAAKSQGENKNAI